MLEEIWKRYGGKLQGENWVRNSQILDTYGNRPVKPTSGFYYRGNSTLLNLAFDRLMNTRRRNTPERAQSLKRWAAPLASFKFHYSIVPSFFVKRHTFLLCLCVNSSECSGR